MILKKLILLFGFLLIFPASAIAVDPTSKTFNSYKFTTTKIEISQDNGQTFTEIFSGSKETNFGSSTESANQKKETICNDVSIPNGTYNYVRAYRSSSGHVGKLNHETLVLLPLHNPSCLSPKNLLKLNNL